MGGQIALVLIVFVHYKGSGSKESLASFYHVLFVAHALPLLATRSLRGFAQLRAASSRRAAPHRILTVGTRRSFFFDASSEPKQPRPASQPLEQLPQVLNLARWTARRASVAPRHFPFGSATSAGATAPGAAAASAQLFS